MLLLEHKGCGSAGVEGDRKMQEVEVGFRNRKTVIGRGGSTALARARVRSWGNGKQQQDDGRARKGLG